MVLLESLDLVSLRKRRFLDMLILVHKSFQAATPACISALFTPRTNINGLRGVNKLQLPRVILHLTGKTPSNFLRPNYGQWKQLP